MYEVVFYKNEINKQTIESLVHPRHLASNDVGEKPLMIVYTIKTASLIKVSFITIAVFELQQIH